MIGETSKNKQDFGEAIKYYLKGIVFEPSDIENFLDLAKLMSDLHEVELSNIFVIFAKMIQQIQTIHQMSGNEINIQEEELIFDIIE